MVQSQLLLLLLVVSSSYAFAFAFAPSSIDTYKKHHHYHYDHSPIRLKTEVRSAEHDDVDTTATATTAATDSTRRILESLGWQPQFDEEWKRMDDYETLIPVRVTEVRSKGLSVVGVGIERFLPRTGRGRRDEEDNDLGVVVVGDWILLHRDTYRQTNIILKRNSLLQRRAPGRNTRRIQLMAANLDTVFIVSSCNQDFNVARMERYIALALEANVEPVIVLTKRDLCDDDDDDDGDDDDTNNDNDDDDTNSDDDDDESMSMSMKWLLDYYVQEASAIAGGTVPVVCLDARGEEPSHQLAQWCQRGQTVAFLGSSGVGKSTLVNALCGSVVADTGAIHMDSGQGRHTTTRRQLFFLPNNGCAVLDTPGLRELQLLDVSYGLGQVFSDFVDLSHHCRFNDCQHAGEPGCAIQAAVEDGTIEDVDRLMRWQKLVAEDLENSKALAERKVKQYKAAAAAGRSNTSRKRQTKKKKKSK
jgi:ribosome biogenesis GTPase